MNNELSTFNFFASPEKEEAWLEQMAQQGWFLIRVTSLSRYIFQKGDPEKRAYKIDYRYFGNARDREDYLALFKDSGWQPVMPREVNAAFYFSNINGNGQKDIFSDEVSKAQRNLRYAILSAYSFFPAFLPLFVLYLTGNFSVSNIGYLTPGLWEMKGLEFIFHFLFETPFVLLRSSLYFLPLLPVALILAFLLRYYMQYRRAARQQMI